MLDRPSFLKFRLKYLGYKLAGTEIVICNKLKHLAHAMANLTWPHIMDFEICHNFQVAAAFWKQKYFIVSTIKNKFFI